MNRIILMFIAFISFIGCERGEQVAQRAQEASIDSLLNSLSLEQKVGQMTQMNVEVFIQRKGGNLPYPLRLDTAKLIEAIQKRGIGSIMNTAGHALDPEDWHYITQTIRFFSQPENGGTIPIIYALDAVHGANYVANSTLFPHQLGMAATWNDSLVNAMGEATAFESRSAGIPWIFSPILDVARQPLWVQFFESFGEDPYLTQRLGSTLVQAYQESEWPVAACAKHFVGYGFPFSGKDRTPVHIGERALREVHLPPFDEAVKSGLRSIMVGSNELDGIPMLANRYWIEEVLRKEIGFDGVILSDWADVAHLADWHRVAKDTTEAALLAVRAGLDMAMVPDDYSFYYDVIRLVNEGKISEERIDASVRRILKMKLDMDLFAEMEAPTVDESTLKAHSAAAYELAVEGITLLKNEDGVLPLRASEPVFLAGPTAHSLVHLNGSWSRTWQGMDTLITHETHPTVYEAMRVFVHELTYKEGSAIDRVGELQDAVNGALESSVIVLCLGEAPATEKPGDRRDLTLSRAQLELANAMLETGRPVVLVLLQDRPQIIAEIADKCAAVIMAYRPGNEGGRALADLLFGHRNFSGHLPFTYPSAVNDLVTYDHKFAETIGPDWGPSGFRPQWEFGHGLSYSSFEYSALSLDQKTYAKNDTIRVSVEVGNSSEIKGKEVVQVYISDEIASVTPPVKRLRDFAKISLKPGEKNLVDFEIPVASLAFVAEDHKRIVEPGRFTLRVGGLEQSFEVK
ncbi:MAG: glycoside hydrolase family 3 N-terminal domain-containing protein [Cryomorphaceae bacterium]